MASQQSSPARGRLIQALVLSMAVAGFGAWTSAAPAVADAPPIYHVGQVGLNACTNLYTPAHYTVPAGVGEVDIVAIGLHGATGSGGDDIFTRPGGSGGRGAKVTVKHVPVNPGDVLYTYASGRSAGDTRVTATKPTTCGGLAANRTLVVAAGGGNGGDGDIFGAGGDGGDAGQPGQPGGLNQNAAGGGGGAGTATHGGAGGAAAHGAGVTGGATAGEDGQFGAGGWLHGEDQGGHRVGGFGGDGYWGGGQGGGDEGDGAGGGGGGSSFVDPSISDIAMAITSDEQSVTITPTGFFTQTTTGLDSPAPVPTGERITFHASVSPAPPNGIVAFTAVGGTATTIAMGSGATTPGGDAYLQYVLPAGRWTVTATYQGPRLWLTSTSSPAFEQVGTKPVVVSGPIDRTVNDGQKATFSASASGDPTPSVQWQYGDGTPGNWHDEPGATAPILKLDTALHATGTHVRAVFTNPLGSLATDDAVMTVLLPPLPTTGPANQTVSVGDTPTFSARAAGNPLPTASWQVSSDGGASWSDLAATTTVGVGVPQQALTSLVIAPATAADNGNLYRAVFTSSGGSAISSTGSLTVLAACVRSNPTPTSFSHCHGADLSGQDLGGVDLSYGDYSDADLAGAQLGAAGAANFAGSNLAGVHFGGSLVQSDLTGADLTGASLFGTDYRLATFTNTLLVPADVTVAGNGPTAATWPTPPSLPGTFFRGCDHTSGDTFGPGHTTVTCYVFDSATGDPQALHSATGTFDVDVIPAAAPQITQQPQDANPAYVPGGATATFTAAATGAPTPTVQWMVTRPGAGNGDPIPGATSPTLTLHGLTVADSDKIYYAIFTNSEGHVVSQGGSLAVASLSIRVVVSGTRTIGHPSVFTSTDDAPAGITLSGNLICTAVYPTQPIDSLPVGVYWIRGRDDCQGLTSSDPNYVVDYTSDNNSNYIVSPGTIAQTAPVGDTYAGGSPPYVSHLNTSGGSGAVTYTQTSGSGVEVAPDGQVSASPLLAPGTYVVEGTDTDELGDVGTWTFTLTVVQVAAVTQQPDSLSVAVGSNATFSAAATGTPVPTVQWQRSTDDGASWNAINGATETSYTILQVGLGRDGDLYRAAFGNEAGTTYTGPALLNVYKLPMFAKPGDETIAYGDPQPAYPVGYGTFTGTDTAADLVGTAACASLTPVTGVGQYTVRCQGLTSDKYEIAYPAGTLTVGPRPLRITADDQARTYGAPDPEFTFTVTGLVNGDQLASQPICGVTGPHADAGSYPISCTGGDAGANYTVDHADGTLSVGKPVLTATASDESMAYGGTVPSVTVAYAGLVNGDTPSVVTGGSCSADVTTGSPVGSYVTTCSGGTASNYSIHYVNGTVKVTPAPITVTVSGSQTFGSSSPVFGATTSVPGVTATDASCTKVTTATITAGLAPGTYPLDGSSCSATLSNPNYAPTYGGSLIVDAAPIVVTVTGSQVYGSASPTFTASTDVSGVTASSVSCTQVSGHVSIAATLGAGSYPVDASSCSATLSSSNYAPTFAGQFDVTRKPVVVTASAGSMIYGGSVPAITASYAGLVNGQDGSALSVQPTCSPNVSATTPAGAYPATSTCAGAVAANYSFSYPNRGTVTVAKAVLTMRASDGSMIYGGVVPTITASLTGFVNGQDASVVSPAPTCVSNVTATTPVGVYASTSSCANAGAANYTFTAVEGTVSVNARTITVTPRAVTSPYGVVPAVLPAYAGFVNGQGPSVLTHQAGCTANTTVTTAAGVYASTSTCAGATAANYTFSYARGTVTIVQAAVAVTTGSSTWLSAVLLGRMVFTTTVRNASSGVPVAGAVVTVVVSGGHFGRAVTCVATTNSQGVATCASSNGNLLLIRTPQPYVATTPASVNYQAGSGEGVIRLY